MENVVLAIWTDADPDNEAEFNDWYQREHVPERVGVLGFHWGRRYQAVDAERTYFACYGTETPEVLRSPAYLARLDNPTDWSRRVTPWFLNMNRSACRVSAAAGGGFGGAAATLDLAPADGKDDALRTWIADDLLPGRVKADGVVAAQLWQADPALTNVEAAEKNLRAGPDDIADWVVYIQASRPEELAALGGGPLLAGLGANGAGTVGRLNVYRLLYGLTGET